LIRCFANHTLKVAFTQDSIKNLAEKRPPRKQKRFRDNQ